jgi:NADPH-dependent 2,4-dienoyl-CoA reductase/sulfur reductase-like enzyme
MPHTPPRVAILGAGPIGLEAALAAAERRWPFTVYERADAVRIGWQQVDDVFGLLDAQR